MKWRYFRVRSKQILWNEDNRVKLRNFNYLPRWLVIAIDLAIVIFSFFLSFLVVSNLNVSFYDVLTRPQECVFISLVYFASFFIFSTYAGLIRHSTFVDIFKIAISCGASALFLSIISYSYYGIFEKKIFLFPFLLINSVLTFAGMLMLRLTVKSLYSFIMNMGRKRHRVLILGVNDDSIAVGEALSIADHKNFVLVGFVSFNKRYKKLKILGVPIFKFDNLFFGSILPLKVNGLILVGNQLDTSEKNNIVDKALEQNLRIYHAPSITQWENDADVTSNIKEIQIEDLLERHPIKLDDTQINSYLNDKTILVTGGAGSIGSEIVRQVSRYKPKQLLILDQAESPLHTLELELRQQFPEVSYEFILADVRKKNRLEKVFEAYEVSVVFHAAAYKHVPLIERNPTEAIQVNIIGTVTLADLSAQYGIDRFVMVSTDKAVNPTNVMGATKRAAEMYVQALMQERQSNTKFITTRFGNVLGSNGSVIPHFKEQIKNGGPVTVTHENIIRYFMTIPEACQLVLQAGTMGQGGEVFVFDMGKPVKIMDLAKKMIKLSGLIPGEDIEISVIGLRPGEKLYEELLSDQSTTLPTHHEKIMRAKDDTMFLEDVMNLIIEIAAAAEQSDDLGMIGKLKVLVPEFKSENSVYELLDLPSCSDE
ncbi:polysaccharide biosynthesis protein [Nonlabens marinus]|uniref:UDP-N-acetylglucosamine 4,6-dehydratase n=1 Tax=Nonlabens marinus S1-08 TaxID=1454201 RepID=W8VS90_9FLAO|nr:nucleoside-diphosphate sugar epimerase/dehydratase [Nonlabens marinus]BAO56724.1 UDP-N-acetylglucosamine 4,6-dehydratase [Nonlabens marinus S1-08]